MGQGHIRRMFPGANTALGFFSFYDQIIEPDATRIIIIKGGPGVGKSTFMRQIAGEMLKQGLNVELHQCSADSSSLDGVVVPEARVALIDGTAPHVFDPKDPGCVGEILHFGDYWDEKGMREHKTEIMAKNREIGGCFNAAYRVLKVALDVQHDWRTINAARMNWGHVNQQTDRILDELFGSHPVAEIPGRVRHLFASAISPDGTVNYLSTLLNVPRRVVVQGLPGTGEATLLRKILDTAVEKGFYVEAFHCSLDPQRIEHLVIPALGVAVTTAHEPHKIQAAPGDRVVNLLEGFRSPTTQEIDGLEYDQKLFWELVERAVSLIHAAKQMHDEMEAFYVPYMNFTAINQLREQTLDRLNRYVKEARANKS